LVQSGTGTLILTGTNTYSGGTTVNAGTLQIGNGAISGSIIGNIFTGNNARVAFNRSDDYTYSGVITGSGSLVQSGTGTLILTGANDYTGETIVEAGTLTIGNGGNWNSK